MIESLNILVGIDGSEHADRALDFALELADKCKTSITILSVVPSFNIPIPIKNEKTEVLRTRVTHELRESHKKVLSEAIKKAKKIKPNLNITTRLEEGQSADKIIDIAKKGNYYMIVMGRRGLGSVETLFLGSVSHKVATKAECPVLIVK